MFFTKDNTKMYVVNLCHTQINSKILTVPIYLLKRILSDDDFQDFRHINIKSESVKGYWIWIEIQLGCYMYKGL